MTVVAKTLVEPIQIPNAATTLYTAPPSTRTIIDKLTITNPTAGALTVNLYLVPSAGAAGASNILVSGQSIAPNTTYLCPEGVGHILNSGDFVSALASAAGSLVFRMSGREVN